LGAYGKIFIVKIKNDMKVVEAEQVARQANRNRKWTQIYANSWERDRLGRRGSRLASRSEKKDTDRDVFGGTPNPAVGQSEQHKSGPLSGLTALPMDRISEYSRLFAPIRGFILNFWKFQKQPMQVVDFQDSFSYFWVPRCFRWN
jgi:hypothetical protein